VRRIDAALDRLQKIRTDPDLRDPDSIARERGPRIGGERRLVVGCAHVGPHDAAGLDRRIGLHAHAVLEAAVVRLRRHVDAGALDVELPAVVDARQPALFVAADHHRGQTVRAARVEQTDAPVRVAERDQILAEQPDRDRGAVGLGDLFAQDGRKPVTPAHRAHRCAAFDLGEQFVLRA
jgi:hypothetical protein